MTAMEDLDTLVTSLPNAALLTTKMKQDALDGALVPDSFGVWPGGDGYVATYDPYFAAIRLVAFLQAQPVVRQSSSEGTSISVDAPNWAGLIAYYQSMSPISQAIASGPLLTKVLIPESSHVWPTDMTGRGDNYGDVDTDLG